VTSVAPGDRPGGTGPSPDEPEAARAPVRVVICDDHRLVAEGLVMLLDAQPDVEVVGMAENVAEVRRLTSSRRPDVVLMDYALPDGDGVSATALIKADHPEVTVVMLTSFVDEDVLVGAIEAGCSGYVTKAKGGDELITAVRLAAEGEALVSADMLARLLPRLRRSHRGIGADLSARERQVLDLLADGVSKEAIADRLVLSTNTVRNHIQNLLVKLGAHSRLEAVATATREGLIHRS
jgi:DNA-binding NarL/FixJ family response regulator